MNNTFFNKDIFPQTPYSQNNIPNTSTINSAYASNLLMEQAYIENILRLNKGKQVRIHMTFPNSNEYRDLEFSGIIEQTGKDYIILSDPSTGKWQLLLMLYVDFITFNESINYNQEFYSNNWFK